MSPIAWFCSGLTHLSFGIGGMGVFSYTICMVVAIVYGVYLFVLRPIFEFTSWTVKTHKTTHSEEFDASHDCFYKCDQLEAEASQYVIFAILLLVLLALGFVFKAPWYIKAVLIVLVGCSLRKSHTIGCESLKYKKECDAIFKKLEPYLEQQAREEKRRA